MADFTRVFDITVPAGSGIKTVSRVPTPLGLCVVSDFYLRWPAGCAGLVGVQVWAGESPAFPNNGSDYMRFDDYVLSQIVQNQINSGQWSVAAWNTDIYDHTLEIVYNCNLVSFATLANPGVPISL